MAKLPKNPQMSDMMKELLNQSGQGPVTQGSPNTPPAPPGVAAPGQINPMAPVPNDPGQGMMPAQPQASAATPPPPVPPPPPAPPLPSTADVPKEKGTRTLGSIYLINDVQRLYNPNQPNVPAPKGSKMSQGMIKQGTASAMDNQGPWGTNRPKKKQ
jgi:hypothetical protein